MRLPSTWYAAVAVPQRNWEELFTAAETFNCDKGVIKSARRVALEKDLVMMSPGDWCFNDPPEKEIGQKKEALIVE